MEDILTLIFVFVDDFCKFLEPLLNKTLLQTGKKKRIRKSNLLLSESLTILIGFQLSGFKTFKKYYQFIVKYHKKEFPNIISYSRFIAKEKELILPLLAFFKLISADCDGESYIDATSLPICHTKREKSNKVFKGLAKKSKSTMGWFFGFKLHLIVTQFGHPIMFNLTKGNVDDRNVCMSFFSKIVGDLYGDRGYIGQEFSRKLKAKTIRIVTYLRAKMRPQLVTEKDVKNLKKRNRIEGVFNVLKNNLNLQHTRHRSKANFAVNIVSSLCAFSLRFYKDFLPKKMDALMIA